MNDGESVVAKFIEVQTIVACHPGERGIWVLQRLVGRRTLRSLVPYNDRFKRLPGSCQVLLSVIYSFLLQKN